MTLILRSILVLAATAAASSAAAQTPAVTCPVVPDSVAGPTPGQIAERRELRDQVATVARRSGVTSPRGLLFIDVDESWKGTVLFLDSNFPEAAVEEGVRHVARYLETLPPGRGYQALVRLDGDFLTPSAGRRHCPPALANGDVLSRMRERVLDTHPQRGMRRTPVERRAVVRVVVNRTGTVSYADIHQPTGDPHLDESLEEIARALEFHPATLDGEPFDVRFRFTIPFRLD
jgi:TonB family protein